MKKILTVLILIAGIATASHAQVSEIKRDTTTNVDTSIIAFNSMGSGLKAIDFLVPKISGTVAGKVYLQASNTGGLSWDNLDSLAIVNQAENKKHFEFTKTSYKSYRAYYTTTGTQSCILIVSYLRRPDE